MSKLLNKDLLDLAREHFKYGRLTGYATVAATIGVHPFTLRRWINKGFQLLSKDPDELSEKEKIMVELSKVARIPNEILEIAHAAIRRNLKSPMVDMTTARWVIERADNQALAILSGLPLEEKCVDIHIDDKEES